MSHLFQTITVQPLDSNHIADTLACVPHSFHGDLLADYERKYTESRQGANLGLIQVQQYAKDKTFLNHDDDSLRIKSERFAREATRLINRYGVDAGVT